MEDSIKAMNIKSSERQVTLDDFEAERNGYKTDL